MGEIVNPTRGVAVLSRKAADGFFAFGAVLTVPPRPTLEPDDIVTPAQAGKLLGIPASTVSTWIDRYGIEPLGKLGRWQVYDYNEIAAIDAKRRRDREALAA